MTTEQPYTPTEVDVRVPYRFQEMGLMRDPNEVPFDAEAMAEADA